jgi:uncharacterized heparinase superfamily protein
MGEWLGEAIIAGPSRVLSERRRENGATVLVLGHNGYVDRYAIVHERRLSLTDAGDRLDGIDSFLTPTGQPIGRSGKDLFAIRFHLAPGVQATRSGSGRIVTLVLPDGETWEFHTDGPEVEIEDSILMSNTRGNRKTLQMVIHGIAQHTHHVAWMMHRTAVGGRRRTSPGAARRADAPVRG